LGFIVYHATVQHAGARRQRTSGVRLANNQIALHAMPVGIATEPPDDRFIHLQHTARLHVVVDLNESI
jgi:hypothetical protein